MAHGRLAAVKSRIVNRESCSAFSVRLFAVENVQTQILFGCDKLGLFADLNRESRICISQLPEAFTFSICDSWFHRHVCYRRLTPQQ